MKIAKALKEKNKFLRELGKLLTKVQKNNSVIEGKTRAYSSKEMFIQANLKILELVELKTKISLANEPIQSKIYKLSELKSLVSIIKELSTEEGPQESSHSWEDTNKVFIYNSEIKTVEKDEMVQNIENEIEKIQEELDIYNHTTEI